jgi:hypothetical protein
MKIIRQRERKTKTEYNLSFYWKDEPNAGFGFDCDEKGKLLPFDNEYAKENYNNCINGKYDVINEGVKKHTWSYIDCAIGKCICGEEVYLDSFTNTCPGCERDYNIQGQLLATRSQWGEETGEHWTECY